MTIQKAIYVFYQFKHKFSVFDLCNYVCENLSTSLRRFGLLEGAQQLLFVIFP